MCNGYPNNRCRVCCFARRDRRPSGTRDRGTTNVRPCSAFGHQGLSGSSRTKFSRTGSQRPEAGRCHRVAMPPDSRAGSVEAGPYSRRAARSARPALPLPPHPQSLGKGLQPGIRLVCWAPQFQSCPVAGGHAIAAPRRIGPVGARSCAQGLVRSRPCRSLLRPRPTACECVQPSDRAVRLPVS